MRDGNERAKHAGMDVAAADEPFAEEFADADNEDFWDGDDEDFSDASGKGDAGPAGRAKEFVWTIAEEQAGERADKFLAEALGEDVSRSQVQQWLKTGLADVDGKPIKPNHKLQAGDRLSLRMPEPEAPDIRPEPIPLDIVYEDKDVIVINKPRGLVVHPAPGHRSGTVVNALLHHCGDLSGINGVLRPGIVHRIDKDTSGLIVAAKNDRAHLGLAAQLKDRSVVRKYIAVVQGKVQAERGTVDAPVGRDPQNRKRFAVTERGGKRAVTHFNVLERLGNYTLLELRLETGRTHQIRVHMKFIGHPLVGDPLYGGAAARRAEIDGQALHAGVLGFRHPVSGEPMEFTAPLPADMERLIRQLRVRA